MATVRLASAGGDTTGTGNRTSTIVAAANDLIVVFVKWSGNSATNPTCTDSGDTGAGAYGLILTALNNASADIMAVFVRTTLVAAATPTLTIAPVVGSGTNTAGEIITFAVTGITKLGSAAVRGSGKQENQTSGVPTPVLPANCLTQNLALQAVGATTTTGAVTNAAWTEPANGNGSQITPTTFQEASFKASGFTGTSAAYVSVASTVWCSAILELDVNATVAVTGNSIVSSVGTVSETGAAVVTTASNPIVAATGSVLAGQIVQLRGNQGASVASLVLAFSKVTTVGNMLACVAACDGATTLAISDSQVNSWSLVKSQQFNFSTKRISMWVLPNCPGGADTVTVTPGVSADVSMIIMEISGVTVSPLDQSASAAAPDGSNQATADSTATATTTSSLELVIGAVAAPAGGTTLSLGSGYGNFFQATTTGNEPALAVENKTVTTTGAYNATFGLSPIDQWGAIVATFINIANVTVTVTTNPLTSVVGSVAEIGNAVVSAPKNAIVAAAGTATVAAGASVSVTNNSISVSVGTITDTGTAVVTTTTNPITGAVGTATVVGNAVVTATGNAIAAVVGTVSLALGVGVSTTNNLITSAVGTVSDTGNAVVSSTGNALVATVRTPTETGSAIVAATGSALTGLVGTASVAIGQTVSATGNVITSAVGTITDTGTAIVSPTGNILTSDVGTVTEQSDANVSSTGNVATASVGTVSEAANANVNSTGSALQGAVGTTSETGTANVSLIGSSAAALVGTVTLGTNASVSTTGNASTSAVGQSSVTGSANVSVVGNVIIASVGTVTITTSSGGIAFDMILRLGYSDGESLRGAPSLGGK